MTSSLMHRVQLKRAFDLTFSFAGLLAALPLMIVIAAAVCAGDRGPVLFAKVAVNATPRRWATAAGRSLRFNDAELL